MMRKLFYCFISVLLLTSSFCHAATARVDKMWYEYDVKQNDQIGIRMHATVSVSGMLGREVQFAFFFFDSSDNFLQTSVSSYSTTSGQLCAFDKSRCSYDNTYWEDYKVFVPYSAMKVSRPNTYYYRLYIRDIANSYSNILVSERKSLEFLSRNMTASLDSVSLIPNVTQGGKAGFNIRGKLSINGTVGSTYQVVFCFYDSEYKNLPGKLDDYKSTDGSAMFYKYNSTFTPNYFNCVWTNQQSFFMPYDALPAMEEGKKYYYCCYIRDNMTPKTVLYNSGYIPLSVSQVFPSASIESTWVEPNVTKDGVRGMNLHASLHIYNRKGKSTQVLASFWDASGNRLISSNSNYQFSSGEAKTSTYVTPNYDNTVFNDLVLFMPYSALPAIQSGYQYRFKVRDGSNSLYSQKWGTLPTSGSVVTKPTITWLSSTSTQTSKTYVVRAGVKSDSKIDDVEVSVNGETYRGFTAVNNDGYDLAVNQSVTLQSGSNQIVIAVKNAAGATNIQKTIYCQTSTQQVVNSPSKCIALVIGNGSYSSQRLANPANDACDVSAKLKSMGWTVLQLTDANKRSMEDKIKEFGEQAKNYEVAMFYYAGHGIQYSGRNFLIPTNVELASPSDIEYDCVEANRVLSKMEEAGCQTNIVVLDACRNNPFERSWSRGVEHYGLTSMNAPKGSFIAYATSPGSVAQDGQGRNSPYTKAFLQALDQPGLSIHEFFPYVSALVQQSTNETQIPWTSSSFTGRFYFHPAN